MPNRKTSTPRDRVCPWCETKYHAAPDHIGLLCPECREELLGESKEFLVDMLGHVCGVSLLTMAEAGNKDDLLQRLGMWEGFHRRPLTMQEFARKRQRLQ
jgi:hypothetical protein